MSRLANLLEHLPPLPTLAACVLMAAAMGLVDYATGVEFHFAVFYLLPVGLAAWAAGRAGGAAIAILCAATWHAGEALGERHYSIPAMAYWNTCMRLVIFLVVAWSTSTLRAALRRARDATERALEASRSKSEFLAGMSHDIRTPMNAVLAMADLLAETPLTPVQREYVDTFRREGQSLLGLINRILDLSKIESGSYTPEVRPMDPHRLLQEILSILLVRAREKSLDLRIHVHPAVPEGIASDPEALRRILVNLVGNAIKFTERGSVELRAEPDPEAAGAPRLRFTVADTGVGIAPEKQADIFQGFSQADATVAARYGGWGLGLSISRRLVEALGGRIWVESTPGIGSTFRFTVPYAPTAPASAPEAAAEDGPVPEDRRPLRVLVADDYPSNLLVVRAYLKALPYAVDTVADGAEALRRFQAQRYDVVLLDVQMPVMDGYTAARQMRAWEAERGRPATPIVALSAAAYRADVEQALQAGCTAHLAKPVPKATLVAAIWKVTGGARSQPPVAATAPAADPAPRIRVQVDADLRPLVPAFLEDARSMQRDLVQAADGGDFSRARGLGHALRGTGGSYGFDGLAQIGERIEATAQAGDADAVRQQARDLGDYLDRVEVIDG